MKPQKILFALMFVMFLSAGSSVVSAQSDWVKLGEKDVNFSIDHDTIGAESKGTIREIHLTVMHALIKLKKVVINHKDGTKREVEYLENLEVGKFSRSITIEGDGHPIKTVDFWYETDTLGGKKAKVAVYGKS